MFNRKIWTISWKIHRPYEWMFGGWTPTYTKEVTGNWYIDLTDAVANKLLELKAYWWCEQAGLPSWYTPLEYVQADWNEYFDTWLYPKLWTKIEIDIAIDSSPTSQMVFWNSATWEQITLYITNGWTVRFDWVVVANVDTSQYITKGTRTKVSVDKDWMYFEWVKKITYTGATSFTANNTMYCLRAYNSSASKFSWKLYWWKVREDGVLVAEYIPCKQWNTVWIYDKVSGKMMEILWTWTFTAWPNIITPTTPVDIVCNNWTLKVKKESWLPFRYKKVEYITASSTQWLNTWIKLASTDIVEAEYKNSSTTWYWALYWVFALWDSSAFYANWTYYWYDVSNNKVNTWVNVDTSRHSVRQDFGNWVITLDNVDTIYTPFTFENTEDNYLFSRYYNNSYWYWFKWSCRKYRIYRWWELICDLIPVIDTQNNDEPWMYDLVRGEFKWNVGSWNFTAWAYAQDDLEVYVDGTKEKVWYSGWATATCEDLLWVWDYQDEQEILSGSVITKVGVMVLDWTEGWVVSSVSSVRYILLEDTTDSNRYDIMSSHFNSDPVSFANMSNNSGCLTRITAESKRAIAIKAESYATLSAWKQFLADQLSAWTPVIVVYPLATPTTLSVAWQHLSIPAWNSRIEIVEWSILDLPLYAKYKSTTE